MGTLLGRVLVLLQPVSRRSMVATLRRGSMQSGGPIRKGGVSAEWTQELQAVDIDVVDVASGGPTGAPRVSLPRRRAPSASSIAPVGLDVPTRDLDQEVSASLVVRPMKRRRLGAVVVGAIAGCALILIAAAIARVGHASDETSHLAAAPAAPPTSAVQAAAPATATSPAPAPATAATTTSGDRASTGSVRLDGPAKPGHVWIDGQKLSSSSAIVSCGTHQVKVSRHKAHSIEVPCGGDVAVSK
jgi:hypothetical protein